MNKMIEQIINQNINKNKNQIMNKRISQNINKIINQKMNQNINQKVLRKLIKCRLSFHILISQLSIILGIPKIAERQN